MRKRNLLNPPPGKREKRDGGGKIGIKRVFLDVVARRLMYPKTRRGNNQMEGWGEKRGTV